MSYIVNKTDGSVLTTILDGTTNTETGLTLIGRNYTNYGEIQNENFVRLLENFASELPPGQSVGFTPIAGQLWWDVGNQRLRVYTGTEFANVSESSVGDTAPTTTKTGDQWWDTTNKQLKVYDGAAWVLINPPYTTAQGKSGAIVETVSDVSLSNHTVVNTYTNNQLISVTSYDTVFQTGAYPQFSFIKPGINLASNVMLHGTATNSLQLGGNWANNFPRTTARTDFLSDLGVAGNLVLGNANVSYSNGTLVINNTELYGNVDFYVNGNFGNTRALRINGTTGMVTVMAEPTSNMGIVTKNYADNMEANLNARIIANTTAINANVTQLSTNVYAALASNVSALNASINTLRTDTNANTAAVASDLTSNVATITANIADKTARIQNLESDIVLKSTIASPAFTGTPTAPNVAANNNSNRIATTAYVDAADTIITNYITTEISSVLSSTQANLVAGLSTKANTISPVFTGVPEAPTPVSTDNSQKIATTAFVRGAITGNLTRWQGSRYTVSTSGPTGGDDGDFWFQIG
jgi:hypothetical protein